MGRPAALPKPHDAPSPGPAHGSCTESGPGARGGASGLEFVTPAVMTAETGGSSSMKDVAAGSGATRSSFFRFRWVGFNHRLRATLLTPDWAPSSATRLQTSSDVGVGAWCVFRHVVSSRLRSTNLVLGPPCLLGSHISLTLLRSTRTAVVGPSSQAHSPKRHVGLPTSAGITVLPPSIAQRGQRDAVRGRRPILSGATARVRPPRSAVTRAPHRADPSERAARPRIIQHRGRLLVSYHRTLPDGRVEVVMRPIPF